MKNLKDVYKQYDSLSIFESVKKNLSSISKNNIINDDLLSSEEIIITWFEENKHKSKSLTNGNYIESLGDDNYALWVDTWGNWGKECKVQITQDGIFYLSEIQCNLKSREIYLLFCTLDGNDEWDCDFDEISNSNQKMIVNFLMKQKMG